MTEECYYLETPEVHCDRDISVNIEVVLQNDKTITVNMCERHWLEFNHKNGKGYHFWQNPNQPNCTVKSYRIVG